MGEPAIPTPDERKQRRDLARAVVAAVSDDLATPPLVAALKTLQAVKPEAFPKAVSTAFEGFDLALFDVAHELVMTRDDVEKLAREMIDEGRREPRNAIASAFGRRLLFVLGVTP